MRTKASSLPFMLTKGRRGWVGLQSVSRVLRYLGMAAAAAAAAREKQGTTSVTPYQPDKQYAFSGFLFFVFFSPDVPSYLEAMT